MNRKLLHVLIVLFLAACGTTLPRGDLPVSDLDAHKANVQREAQRQRLSNGKEYCGELAATEEAQEDCIGDLEDALFTANNQLDAVLKLTNNFVHRMKLLRNPCGFWQRTFNRQQCSPKNSATPD